MKCSFVLYFAVCETYQKYDLPKYHMSRKLMSMVRTKVPRIINGEDADIQNYPWQASLRIVTNHICGAAVVSQRAAITAAHCIKNEYKRLYKLQVGSSRLSGKGTVVDVADVIVVSIDFMLQISNITIEIV
ncbi:chymotrypsin-1-like [Pecten maximus]|uniref:chymotrypsin-1-like n=1 Tax=Pecten maximus TaxID=6579 RepID=UPI001458841D|nr:chymotrypsin-1-like [Pecten maximus]